MRLKHMLAGMLVAAPITAHAADVVTSLATPGDSGRGLSADSDHPNDAGHALIAPQFTALLRQAIQA